jgi:O-antigen/teichoic acid export membrane protein
MSEYRELAKHSSHYLVAQVAVMAAGFVSLPILTRLLSKQEYGLLSLILLSVNFLAPFARLGIPQSIPRFYAAYARDGEVQIRSYVSSLMLCSIGLVVLVAVAFWVIGFGVGRLGWDGLWRFLWLVGPLLAGEVMLTVLGELYRAELRSAMTASMSVISRYAALGGSVLCFIFFSQSLDSLLVGKAAAQLAVVAIFALPLIASGQVGLGRIDSRILAEGVRYGLPLSLAASGGFFIAYGDRYVIQSLLDSTQVATYSVPYDLLSQLEAALSTPVRMALIPLVFSILAKESTEQASALVSDVLRGVIFLIVPVICGISFVGSDVLVLLASQKYADAAPLLPVLSVGILFGGISFLFSIGLMFQKRTGLIACLTLGAGLFNIVLNALLIPKLGVMGSAWATLVTYLIYPAVSYSLSSRYLRLRLYPMSFLKALVSALTMLAALWLTRPAIGSGVLALVIEVCLGSIVYFATLTLLEEDVRRYPLEVLKRGRVALRIAA